MALKNAKADKLRSYPNNFEAEQAMLGAILSDGEVADEYLPQLFPEDFYNPKHKSIISAMKAAKETASIDVISVNDTMVKLASSKKKKLSGSETLNEAEINSPQELNVEENIVYLGDLCSNLMYSASNASEYFRLVKRDSTLRDLIRNCNSIVEMAYTEPDLDMVLRTAESLIYSISQKMQRSDLIHINKILAQFNARINQMMSDKNSLRGLSTGFDIFDKKTNGLQKGDLIILAARPSVGKTSLALNIAANIAAKPQTAKKNIAVFSLEMPAVQLVQRVVCNLARVPMGEVSSGKFEGDSLKNIWKVTKPLGNSSLYIDDNSLQTPKMMLSKLRRLSSKVGSVDLVIVDYLQLVESDKHMDSRQQEITAISRMMKIIAKEINCPVIVLSQMSRGIESRNDKEARLSDLRESGAIEQDADIVLFLSREDEKLKDLKEFNVILTIAKHRNGELGKIRLFWQGAYIRFTESGDQNIFDQPAKPQNREDV